MEKVSMQQLVDAIIKECSLNLTGRYDTPVPPTLPINLEARIMGFLAQTFNLCSTQQMMEHNHFEERMDAARRRG